MAGQARAPATETKRHRAVVVASDCFHRCCPASDLRHEGNGVNIDRPHGMVRRDAPDAGSSTRLRSSRPVETLGPRDRTVRTGGAR